ncbi:hypothetical protein AAG906_019035 [Vitis piasezkii]
MADIVISVVEKVAEYLVDPIVRPLGYLFNYRSNLDELEEQVERLGNARERLQHDVDEANRQGDDIEIDVRDWLTRTEEIIQRARELIEDEKAANTSYFNLKLRHQRSSQAKKQSEDIGKIQESKFDRVSYRLSPRGIWSPRLRDCEALESRASILNEIMEALRNDDIRMIGVWGWAVWAKPLYYGIKYIPNSKCDKIQEEIAGILGLKFGQEGELERADRLCKSLNKKKTVLVILDDIWEELSLEKIGIPYGVHKGCKVLLTSREQNFHIQHLCEQEAWNLFKNTAGNSVEELELRPIALEVVKECEGLPVAIVTIAKALTGESVALSYNRLEGDEVKRLFLLCGMLGYGDISMDQLLKCGMGLDLFEHVSSLEQIRNKLVTLVKTLKDSSLLLDAEDPYQPDMGPGFVRMHDVVGDVARAIAAEDPHRFVVIKEALGLEEWQRKEEFRHCSRISLQCGDLRELPERLVCSKLEFFLLNETELLKVLDLSATNYFTPLPSSLGFLSNLRTLRVYRCTFQDIAVIGELKKLQVLSFADCKIERLPKEFMQLTDLRALELSDCSHLQVIPRNVISSLSRLEHLCFAESFTKWGAEGSGSGESNNACLSELNNLSDLKTLCIEITDPDLLSKDLVFEKLTRYMISVSHVPNYRSARTVEDLELYDFKDTKHVLYEFDTDDFLQLKRLSITACPGIQYIVDSTKGVPSHSAFPILEELEILKDCTRLKSFISLPMEQGRDRWVNRQMGSLDLTRDFIFTGKSATPFFNEQVTLPSLEDLKMANLDYVIAIWHNQLPLESWCKLKSLDLIWCRKLLNVFPSNILKGFQSLEYVSIYDCDSIEEIFYLGGVNSKEIHDIATIPLEELTLERLNGLKSIWNKDPQGLVSFQNLQSLKVVGCPCLKYIFPITVAEGLVQLKFLGIKYCGVEEIVANENGDEVMSSLFPELTSLTLKGLNKLKGFYRGTRIARWPHLKSLIMWKSGQVKTLFQDIDSDDCIDSPIQQSFFLLEKDAFLNLELLILKDSKMKIWQVLKIKMCHNILVVIPCSRLPKLHNLKELYVSECNSVKEVMFEKDPEALEATIQLYWEYDDVDDDEVNDDDDDDDDEVNNDDDDDDEVNDDDDDDEVNDDEVKEETEEDVMRKMRMRDREMERVIKGKEREM